MHRDMQSASRVENPRRWRSASTFVLGLVPALVMTACGEEQSPADGRSSALSTKQPARAKASPARGNVITLITGDRVTLLSVAAGRAAPKIDPGPGREKISFSISRRDGGVTVVPEDVAGLIGSGRLDPALFNVTRLLEDGYGDEARRDTPLLITGAANPTGLQSQAPGLTIDHVLPSLHILAVRQEKSKGGAALASLASLAALASNQRASSAAAKIWLDRRRELSLDQSVPQIGAPAAYARGLTGAGVTVAVLDTGVDATHPDLIGKVALAETFLDDGGGTSDVFGHGTHVASIVAGSGAASGGAYHGVAPGATLISGRVCDANGGCYDSAILAGMEWAIGHGAQIVNLSLGGTDGPELDPLEQAVNELSAQHGTLFVIAAGNSGYVPQTVSSPSSADAALSVGAVNRSNARASFSGQGPRVGDHAIKPDLTAPGVGIVAARAAGTLIGEAVGASYVRLNGTSMATPHVAGAAALLLQQHPGWTGQQLKSALMGASQPNASLSVYQQGTGRVDVGRATGQAVTVEPASLSLGAVAYPHDDDEPIVRAVRYRNDGAAPVILALAATLVDRAGDDAPAGAITVAPASLTVPPGGSADAVVTVDTSLEAPTGMYSGELIASGSGARLVTAIGVERESESRDLTVALLDSAGQPADGFVSLFGVGEPEDPASEVEIYLVDVSGEQTFRLPVGTYIVDAFDSTHGTWLIAPHTVLSADATVTMDGRLARPIALSLPEPNLSFFHGAWDFEDNVMFRGSAIIGARALATAEIGPSAPPGAVYSNVTVAFAGDPARSVYSLAKTELDHFATGWRQTFRPRDFATVEADHAGPADRMLVKVNAAIPQAGGWINGFAVPPYLGPFHRTEHFYGEGFSWYAETQEAIPYPPIPELPMAISSIDTITDYRAGRHYREAWNRAPFGPAFAERTLFSFLPSYSGAPLRYANYLLLAPGLFADQAVTPRNGSTYQGETHGKLFRDGELIAESEGVPVIGIVSNTTPALATYRLEAEATRPSELFELSTEVSAAWTFRAQDGDETLTLPLPTLRFFPALDEHNQTSASSLLLPIRVERPSGSAAPSIASARVEVSFDDGATWKRLPIVRVGEHALGLVVHPRNATHVSLRGTASDAAGNSVEQTIVRAYAVSRR